MAGQILNNMFSILILIISIHIHAIDYKYDAHSYVVRISRCIIIISMHIEIIDLLICILIVVFIQR